MKPQPLDIVAEVAARYRVEPERVLKARTPYTRLVRREAIIAIRLARPKIMSRQLKALFGPNRDIPRRVTDSRIAGELPELPVPPDPHELIKSYAAANKGAVRDIMSKDKFAEVLKLRWGCIRHVHKLRPDLTTVELGRLFGVHHTTILYACGRTARSRDSYRPFKLAA